MSDSAILHQLRSHRFLFTATCRQTRFTECSPLCMMVDLSPAGNFLAGTQRFSRSWSLIPFHSYHPAIYFLHDGRMDS